MLFYFVLYSYQEWLWPPPMEFKNNYNKFSTKFLSKKKKSLLLNSDFWIRGANHEECKHIIFMELFLAIIKIT